jgi:hypothetical protein
MFEFHLKSGPVSPQALREPIVSLRHSLVRTEMKRRCGIAHCIAIRIAIPTRWWSRSKASKNEAHETGVIG